METVLKTCISSASYMLSSNSRTNKDSVDPAQCGTVLSSLGHSAAFARSSSSGGSSYLPCSFPSSVSLPRTGSHSKDHSAEVPLSESRYRVCGCPSPPSEPPSGCTLQTIPSPCSSPSCASLRLNPCPSSSSSSAPEGEGRWVRPLGYAERFMTLAGHWGNMSTVYALWFDSEGPVSFEYIKLASQMMFRKMPHLRLCIRNHKNSIWWKEMETDRLDIEEVESDGDVISIFESLLKRKYVIEEGPLWFVRFVRSVNGNDLVRDSNFNIRHKYVCIFGFHHNVSDGTTNMHFCNIFISLLNDLLQNKAVDTSAMGHFAFPIHDDLARAATNTAFLLQLFGVRVYKGLIAYCEYVRNFLRHYPMPSDQDGCTRVLQNEFNEVTTERLLKRCKMEGVTLNSAFTAAANIGMYRMILQRDGSVDETRFDSQQAVNMRRYWPKDKQSGSYGCHISMVDVQIHTRKEEISHFWEYARKIHALIYEELNVKKRTMKMQPLSEKLWIAIFVNSWMSKFRLPSANDSHYCITNMGDISSTLKGEFPEVNVSKVLRSVSCHFMQALCQHTVQTYKGKFYYSLDYYPQKMSAGTATAYASSLMDTLRTSIHVPN